MRSRTKKAPAEQQQEQQPQQQQQEPQQQQQQRSETSPIGKAEKIQHRAYELFVQRGKQPGHELEDWLQAEQEVCAPGEHHETA